MVRLYSRAAPARPLHHLARVVPALVRRRLALVALHGEVDSLLLRQSLDLRRQRRVEVVVGDLQQRQVHPVRHALGEWPDEVVGREVDELEARERREGAGQRPRQLVVGQVQRVQLRQPPERAGERAHQVVPHELQRAHVSLAVARHAVPLVQAGVGLGGHVPRDTPVGAVGRVVERDQGVALRQRALPWHVLAPAERERRRQPQQQRHHHDE